MENYWGWENSLKNVLAGLIILANTLLITIIWTSKKCRKQVGLNNFFKLNISFLFGQRISLMIVSLAVIDLIVGFIIPINTHMINWYRYQEEEGEI